MRPARFGAEYVDHELRVARLGRARNALDRRCRAVGAGEPVFVARGMSYDRMPSLGVRENVALVTAIADDPMRPEEVTW